MRRSHPQPWGTSSACSGEVVPSFLQYFAVDFYGDLSWIWGFFGDCAVPRREDAVHCWGSFSAGFGSIPVGIAGRGSALISRWFLEEFLVLSLLFPFSICAEPGKAAFSLRRVFAGIFGGRQIVIWLLGFVWVGELMWPADF